jgi:hypothetical protein
MICDTNHSHRCIFHPDVHTTPPNLPDSVALETSRREPHRFGCARSAQGRTRAALLARGRPLMQLVASNHTRLKPPILTAFRVALLACEQE